MTVAELHSFRNSPVYATALKAREVKQELDSLPADNFDPDLYEAVNAAVLNVQSLTAQVRASISDRASAEKSRQEAMARKLELEKLTAFYKMLLETLTNSSLKVLSDILSEVYSVVYANPDKRVILKSADYRGKKVVRLSIVNRVDGQEYEEDFEEGGGSLQIVLGIALEIYFIRQSGAPRIMFLDESLSSLADVSLARFLACLQRFSERWGFVFVVVDHSVDRFLDTGMVDCYYRVADGTYTRVQDSRLRSEACLATVQEAPQTSEVPHP